MKGKTMNKETCKLLMTPEQIAEQIAEGERKLALARKKRRLEKIARKFTSRTKAMTFVSKIY